MQPREAVSPRTPGRRALRWVSCAALLLLAAAAIFIAVLSLIPTPKPTPAWTSSSGAPTPPDFLYAMFPTDSAVPLYDSPGDRPVATLNRAVVNSQREIDAGGWVQVLDPGGPYAAELSKLDYLPQPNASPGRLFAAFETSYRARNPADARSASLTLDRAASGVTTARLRLHQNDHWQEYIYDATPGHATPREMYQVFGPGEAFRDIGRLILASAAAIAFVILAVIACLVVALRSRASGGGVGGGGSLL